MARFLQNPITEPFFSLFSHPAVPSAGFFFFRTPSPDACAHAVRGCGPGSSYERGDALGWGGGDRGPFAQRGQTFVRVGKDADARPGAADM